MPINTDSTGEVPTGEVPTGEMPRGEMPNLDFGQSANEITTQQVGSTDFVITSSSHSFSGISDAVLVTVADSETTELAADEDDMDSTDETTSETSKEATEKTLVDSLEVAADTDDVETSDNAKVITYIVIIAFSLVLIISVFSINLLFKKLDKE